MSIVDTIHTLNSQLATITKNRDQALAEQKYLKEDCEKKLAQLKNDTGLDALTAFQSGDVTGAGKILKDALSKEQATLEEKAELASKLVQAFEAGDFFAMNELLGIKVEEKSITEEYRESKAEASGVEASEVDGGESEEEQGAGSVEETQGTAPAVAEELDFELEDTQAPANEPAKSTAVGEVDDLEGLGIDLSLPGEEAPEEPTTQGTATVDVDDFDFDF